MKKILEVESSYDVDENLHKAGVGALKDKGKKLRINKRENNKRRVLTIMLFMVTKPRSSLKQKQGKIFWQWKAKCNHLMIMNIQKVKVQLLVSGYIQLGFFLMPR